MFINFSMIVRDRPKLTKQALESLESSTDLDVKYTIVDDQSLPETEGILREWADADPESRFLARVNRSRGVGWARNLSIHLSQTVWKRGDFLYLADNDSAYTKNWLDKLIKAWPTAKENEFKILGAYNHSFQGPISDPIFVPGVGSIYAYYAVGTLSWFLEWETLDKYGKFDAHALGVRQSEDWALCQRIIKDGFKVGAITPHLVHHTGLHDTFGKPDPGIVNMKEIPGVVFL